MADDFRYEALNRINDSLNATNVVSDDYKKFIMGWALHACSQAWEAGIAQAKGQVGKDTLAPVAASLESFLGESNRPSDSHIRQWAETLRKAIPD